MAYTTINKSGDYFNTKLYTGNATNSTSITGVGFQPDLLWIKDRTNVNNHSLQDAVRGAGYNLQTNTTNAQGLATETISSFDTDGWTMNNGGGVNGSGAAFASWNWLGANGTTANTDGTISSTVSANTTSGFSIVSYTGTGSNATVGHGLGSLCKWIIIKRLNGTNNWEIGNTAMGWGKHIYFTTTAQMTNSNRFQDTAPTNSVFYIGDGEGVNASGGNYIAYCFAEKQGFSKFGSYVGNNNADGTFVYTGFSPAFIMVKKTSGTGGWQLRDNKRTPYGNETLNLMYASAPSAEQTTDGFDFLSNGFKWRNQASDCNGTGDYIYMAFAEAPLVGTNNVPANAR